MPNNDEKNGDFDVSPSGAKFEQESKEKENSVECTPLKRDPRRILIIGESKSGKSKLVQALLGQNPNQCNENYKTIKNFVLGSDGNKNKLISLIDIEKIENILNLENSSDLIAFFLPFIEDVRSLKCIGTIVLTVDGNVHNYRKSFHQVLTIINMVFSASFWEQVFFVFTKLPMDEKSLSRRKRINGADDHTVARGFLKLVKDAFPNNSEQKYSFIDSCYDPKDEREKKAYDDGVEKLWLHHENSPRFSTDKIKMGAKEIENLKKELGIAMNTPEPCVIANQRVDISEYHQDISVHAQQNQFNHVNIGRLIFNNNSRSEGPVGEKEKETACGPDPRLS